MPVDPVGGFVDCTKPEHPQVITLRHSTTARPPAQARPGTLNRAILQAATTLSNTPSNNIQYRKSSGPPGLFVGNTIPRPVVLTLTLTLTALPFTATPLGTPHVAPLGAPVQLNVTFPLNPSTGATLSV